MIAGRQQEDQPVTEDSIRGALHEALANGLSRRDAAAEVSRRLGIPRRQAYDLVIHTAPTDEADT